ncbi:hypothetical protein ACGFIW_01175 [Micromonospora sp. NPDC048935]|uniref:hypothetical protein n=1 Tax=Micromonospora sp. NPDC048935 TaxID=3364262 RepID=UPI003718651D
MTARQYTEVACDGRDCFNAFNDIGTFGQVRSRAKQCGWKVAQPGGRDFCSTTCRNEPEERR